jgi:hypothetical protein
LGLFLIKVSPFTANHHSFVELAFFIYLHLTLDFMQRPRVVRNLLYRLRFLLAIIPSEPSPARILVNW